MNFRRKITVLLIILSLVFPSAFLFYPNKANAVFVPVSDIAHTGITKVNTLQQTLNTTTSIRSFLTETVLKNLAMNMLNAIIHKMTADIVQWINNGFDGNPAFVTDFGGLLTDTVDEELGRFIEGTELGFLCSPFRLDIRIALARSRSSYRQRSACTLTGIGNNVQGFVQGNNSGGWDKWLEMTTKPQNNPYGSFLMAQNEVSMRIAGRQNINITQLNWGNGFMSWQKCTDIAVPGDADFTGPVQPGGNLNNVDTDETLLANNPEVGITTTGQIKRPQSCKTQTPGSVIEEQVNQALGSDMRRLELADDINEIINALMGQLVKQALGGIGGLLGASKGNSSNGGKSVVNYYANLDTGTTNAFSSGDSEVTKNRIDAMLATKQGEQDTIVSTITNTSIANANSSASSAQSIGSGLTTDTSNFTTKSNVSSGKPAKQSSTRIETQTGQWSAGLAVDGSTNNASSAYYANMAKTENELRPWWEVDLGKNYNIDNVILVPSSAPGDNTLSIFHIFISSNPFPSDFNPLENTSSTIWKSPLLTCTSPCNKDMGISTSQTIGRYVRIQSVKTTSTVLELVEVLVNGTEASTESVTIGNPVSPTVSGTILLGNVYPSSGTTETSVHTSCYQTSPTNLNFTFGMDATATKSFSNLSLQTTLEYIDANQQAISKDISNLNDRNELDSLTVSVSNPLGTKTSYNLRAAPTPVINFSANSGYTTNITYTGTVKTNYFLSTGGKTGNLCKNGTTPGTYRLNAKIVDTSNNTEIARKIFVLTVSKAN